MKESTADKELELEVKGMTCGHCVGSVKKALEGVAGVQSVRVSLPEAKAWVAGSPDPQALIEAVVEEGYQASLEDGKGARK